MPETGTSYCATGFDDGYQVELTYFPYNAIDSSCPPDGKSTANSRL